ncbi:CLUMA_CG021292, isoform A [Clunio marinus]|uniref:CLUMA_CG021292, isoform A n=1 Tax=Clunio marinus TaxID=568069 RepID=A0A1J1J8K4_9DIPT|nr:CLUMA_CG021292, isoform A [Clunio marinus]
MINADDLDHVLIGISIFFAIITFVVPFVFIKGPDQDIIRSCCVIAGISCYLLSNNKRNKDSQTFYHKIKKSLIASVLKCELKTVKNISEIKNKQISMAPTFIKILTFFIILVQLFCLTRGEIGEVQSELIIEAHENLNNELFNEETPQIVIEEDEASSKLTTTEASQEDVECSHCNKISEMPMEIAEKINEISDVDEFIHEFVDDSISLSNASSSYEHPSSRRRRGVRDGPRQATCQPIDTVVSLVQDERDPTVFYFPSCVLMKQCGGCCAHSGTTCSPIEETDKQITIKKTKFSGGSKFQSLGDVTVTVKEHNRCKCQCKKTASSCNSLQKFIANQCRCECINIAEAESCTQDPTKLFDTKSCACVCRDTKECATGLQYDQSSCSCQPITFDDEDSQDFQFFGDHMDTEAYGVETDDTKYETIPETG